VPRREGELGRKKATVEGERISITCAKAWLSETQEERVGVSSNKRDRDRFLGPKRAVYGRELVKQRGERIPGGGEFALKEK